MKTKLRWLPLLLCALATAAYAASLPPLIANRAAHLDYEVGPYALPDSGWWIDANGVELSGDGRNEEGRGLWFAGGIHSGNSQGLRLGPNAGFAYVHDLTISNAAGYVIGTGDGIVYNEAATVTDIVLERVGVYYAGSHALRFTPRPVEGAVRHVVSLVVRDTHLYGAGGDGVLVEDAPAMDWTNVYSQRHHQGYAFVFRRLQSSTLNRLTAEDVQGGMLLEECYGVTISAPHCEQFAGTGAGP